MPLVIEWIQDTHTTNEPHEELGNSWRWWNSMMNWCFNGYRPLWFHPFNMLQRIWRPTFCLFVCFLECIESFRIYCYIYSLDLWFTVCLEMCLRCLQLLFPSRLMCCLLNNISYDDFIFGCHQLSFFRLVICIWYFKRWVFPFELIQLRWFFSEKISCTVLRAQWYVLYAW